MELIVESLLAEWRSFLLVLPRIAIAITVIATSYVIGRVLGHGLEKIVRRSSLPNTHGSFFRSLVVWLCVFLGVLLALNLVGMRSLATGLITGGGATAVVLGFAFREIGENFLAGFFLAFSRPFKVGDLIESDNMRGTVVSIELRYTHVRSVDGRDIFIPSSQIFKNPLVNYTRDGLRRFAVTVGIDYNDDPLLACAVLAKKMKEVEGVLSEPPSAVIANGLLDSWIELEISYWINTFDQNLPPGLVKSQVVAAARDALLENGNTVSASTVSNLSLQSIPTVEVSSK